MACENEADIGTKEVSAGALRQLVTPMDFEESSLSAYERRREKQRHSTNTNAR